MKAIRWAAVAVTALMSLMNLPIAFDDGGSDIATPLAWGVTVLGVLGLVAAVALLRRVPWGRPAVLAVGAVNLVGAVVALANEWEGATMRLAWGASGLDPSFRPQRLEQRRARRGSRRRHRREEPGHEHGEQQQRGAEGDREAPAPCPAYGGR